MKLFSVALCLVVGVATQGGTQNYCTLCPNHTMCAYKGPGAACQPRQLGGVSKADKSAILKTHNDLRQRVAQGREGLGSPGPQSAASNMRLMTWDEELATVAQRWADQCSFGHDSCRKVARFPVGQNVAWMRGPSSTAWASAVRMWYDEVQDYNGSDVSPFRFSMKTGHYTQVVWAGSHLLGCGYTRYQQAGSAALQHLYVCNYGPAGNIIQSPLYRKGEAASACPTGTSPAGAKGYPGLCS